MIKLKDILNEAKDSIYYDFQIRINPGEYNLGTFFLHQDGRIQKSTTSVDDNPLILNYRNVPGMVKAALKQKTSKSVIVIWDETGKGKTYPLTSQAIKKIKK